MDEHAALLRNVLNRPEERAPYLVFADWLDEHGEMELGYAYRWMAMHGQRPRHRRRYPGTRYHRGPAVPEPFSWAWYPSWLATWQRRRHRVPRYAILPQLVYQGMGSYRDSALFGSFEKAVAGLAAALANLDDARSLYGSPGPAPVCRSF